MTSLKVGDTVTLKVRNPLWPRKHVYAQNVDIQEFNYYTGTLVAPLRGDSPTSVRITSGEPHYPVRLIDIDRIEGLDLPKKREVKATNWVVVGSRGSKYNIARDGSEYSCTCQGYEFRRRCRHIDELKQKLEAA